MLTAREVIKTFYNALIHKLKKYSGNWGQNDPNAADYVKNRPFYIDESKTETVVKPTIFQTGNLNQWCSPFVFIPEIGETYKVTLDGVEYICECYYSAGLCIGDEFATSYEIYPSMPFFYFWESNTEYGLCMYEEGNHNITIEKLGIKKIDKKFLPDMLLAPVATSGNYNDLINKPTIYSDVVRYRNHQNLTPDQQNLARSNIHAVGYDVNQGLSTTYKANARANIGAVGYEAQTLSDSQKSQARTNIGAGTGNYNDLTNKPSSVLYTTQSLTNAQKQTARDNIGAGTSNFDGYYSSLQGKPQINWNATEGSNGYIANRPCYDDVIDEFIWSGGGISSYDTSSGLYYAHYTTYSSFKGLSTLDDPSLCFAMGYPSYKDERVEFSYASFTIHCTQQYASSLYCWGNPWLAVKYTRNSLYKNHDDAMNVVNPLTEEELNNGLPFCFCNDGDGGSWIGVSNGFLALSEEPIDLARVHTRTKEFLQLDEKFLPTASAEVKGGVKIGRGLRMDGDVLGVVPEEYELIESIEITEADITQVVRTDLKLLAALGTMALPPTPNGSFGLFMQNYYNDTLTAGSSYGDKNYESHLRWEIYQEKGFWNCEAQGQVKGWGGGSIRGMNNCASLYKASVNEHIRGIRFYATNDSSFPVGTKIALYGVRANA